MIDPIGVDIPYLFFVAIFLYMIVFNKYKFLFVLAIIGTSTKEAFIPLLMILFFLKLIQKKNITYENKKINFNLKPIDPEIKYIFIALVSAMLCKFIITLFFPSIQTGRHQSSIVMVAYYCYLILKNPVYIPNWITGIVLFYGPLLYLLFKKFTFQKLFLDSKGILLGLTFVGILLAIIGGGDHTRIAFLSFPFFFTYILYNWQDQNPKFQWLIFLSSMGYLSKCWRYLPTATDDWSVFLFWYPETSSFKFFLPELSITIISMIILYLNDKITNKKTILP